MRRKLFLSISSRRPGKREEVMMIIETWGKRRRDRSIRCWWHARGECDDATKKEEKEKVRNAGNDKEGRETC
jgi:hypothetical protein